MFLKINGMEKQDKYKHITHESIPPFINHDSKVLILGSFPSIKSREDGFFYAHPRNRFFKTLSALFNEEEPIGVSKRKEFLIKHNIALYDVIYECDIIASSDASIKNAVPIDLEGLLKEYPSIKCIALNGGKAKELFNKYLLPKIKNKVEIIYLSSTSPLNARMKDIDLINEYKSKLNIF